MSRRSDPPPESGAVRAQKAIVLALSDQLGRMDPAGSDAAGLRKQLVEEAGRLEFRIASADAGAQGSATMKVGNPEPATGPRRPRILLVDDDDGTRTALARWLGLDYDVVTARTGEEGFAAASAAPPDVIVTDIWMPRVDGVSMIQTLRRLDSLRTVPVIFVTAAEENYPGLLPSGTVYLQKPIDLDLLDRAIREALRAQGSSGNRDAEALCSLETPMAPSTT